MLGVKRGDGIKESPRTTPVLGNNKSYIFPPIAIKVGLEFVAEVAGCYL